MPANKPMTGEQLDELMTVAVNMQRESEKSDDRPSAMFAYAVQVAVLELRKVRDAAAALAAENAGLKAQLRDLFNSCDTGERRGNGSMSGSACPEWHILELTRQFLDETPATDAFLAEVRASALDEFAKAQDEQAKKYYEMSPGCTAQDECQFAASQAWYFAECIRKGVQS
ncbi:TPA: hypothetical protein R4S04_000570 [Enterobacter bugandensis]|nr:hypothetical protein [Enterobacter bugandensis]